MKLSDTPSTRRRIIALAIPALGTLAVKPLYVLVDTAIVGRLGTPQLAGVAIASTILLTVVSLTVALEYGITPDIAFAHGQGRVDDARVLASDGLMLAVGLGTVIGTALAISARWLSWLIGGRGEVLDHATTYLRIAALGLPLILIAYVGHGVKRGMNSFTKPLIVVAIANVVNVVLEIVAVHVLRWGVAGSAWSTVVAQAGAAVGFVFILAPHTTWTWPRWVRIQPLLRSGLHFALRSIAMFAVWNTATAVAARIDTPTLAANQVITQIFMFASLGLDALAIPAQSLVAGALGSGDRDEADHVGWTSARLSLWCGIVLGVVMAVSGPWIAPIFAHDGAVQSRLVGGLVILAMMQLPGAIAFAFDGALIGAEDERWLARQAVRNLAAYAPLAVLTLFVPAMGLIGLLGAQAMWMTTRAWVNTNRWRFLFR